MAHRLENQGIRLGRARQLDGRKGEAQKKMTTSLIGIRPNGGPKITNPQRLDRALFLPLENYVSRNVLLFFALSSFEIDKNMSTRFTSTNLPLQRCTKIMKVKKF